MTVAWREFNHRRRLTESSALIGRIIGVDLGRRGKWLFDDKLMGGVSGMSVVPLPVFTANGIYIPLNPWRESCIKEVEMEVDMTSQPWKFMPATILGKWSVWLIVAMPILFFIGGSLTDSLYASVPSGNSIMEDIAARPALALSMLAGMAAGISAFITGLLAIIKKEHALLVYASSVVGAFLLVFLAGEILFPH